MEFPGYPFFFFTHYINPFHSLIPFSLILTQFILCWCRISSNSCSQVCFQLAQEQKHLFQLVSAWWLLLGRLERNSRCNRFCQRDANLKHFPVPIALCSFDSSMIEDTLMFPRDNGREIGGDRHLGA